MTCTLYPDGSCSCARDAGVAGSCAACAASRNTSPRGAGDITTPLTPFPIWPIVAVGVVAVGIFVATLAINKKR